MQSSVFTYYLLRLFLALCLLIGKVQVYSQENNPDDPRVKRIITQLNEFYTEFPSEKVYLHVDKTTYTIDEIIWFKAYLVNGTNHFPEELSTNLYVELANSDGSVVNLIRLKVKNGFAHGDMSLSDTLRESYYHIRAYTAWMINFDYQLIPTYTIYIKNEKYDQYIDKNTLHKNKRINKKNQKALNETRLQFFPEGGDLIDGLESRSGFKAVDGIGNGVDVTGTVYEKEGGKVNEFRSLHKGIGSFLFTPQPGKQYFAMIDGSNQKFDLPEPRTTKGTVMKVTNISDDLIHVQINSNQALSNDKNANEVILIAHVRGKSIFSSIISLENAPVDIEIKKEEFPTGVVHITLFNYREQPIAERLVFVNHHDRIQFDIEQNMSESFDDKVSFDIYAYNSDTLPVEANFSVSVTPRFEKLLRKNDSKWPGIATSLLLNSDVNGNIEDVEFYFSNNPNASKALDNLLITQGWRRFNWKDIIDNKFPEIVQEHETGISVTGKITREFFGIPYSNSKIELIVLNQYNDIYSTTSDEHGNFSFNNLNYPDTINIEIYARKPNGRKNLLINLDEGELPTLNYPKESYDKYVIAKAQPTYVIEKKLEKEGKLEPKNFDRKNAGREKYGSILGEPNYVILSEEIPEGYNNVFQVLQGRVPGVQVSGSNVLIRGPSSISSSTEPLYLVDNFPTDAQMAGSISLHDIERIEIFSGAGASIYGLRGANGIIAIYTKRGEYMKRGFIKFEMLGYYTAREFYQPEFSSFATLTDFKNLFPTIYWNATVKTNIYGKATISFEVPSFEFQMDIRINGITKDGIPGQTEKIINLN